MTAPLDRRIFLAGASATALWPLCASAPDDALAATDGAALPITEVAPGLFVHQGEHALMTEANEGGIANIGFFVGTEAVAVIDTGGSARQGARLLAAIQTVTDRPIRYVINTHMHPDHVFGNAAFARTGAAYVGHKNLPRGLAARAEHYLDSNARLMKDALQGTEIVLATQLVEFEAELDLGGRTLRLVAHRTAHTDNDLTVRDSAGGWLWASDLVFMEHIPTLDGSILGWLDVLEGLGQLPIDRIVPGHGPASAAWPQAAAPVQRYLRRLTEDIRPLIREGRTIAEAVEIVALDERAHWQLFDEFHARNVTAAFTELEWE
ncbi:MAG: quinoprotein relay system zinc metallohydrolase 2 [Alphaproteobacteria bacterium]|nr:quinoprotein relay system zinc metallohydrolase 2 [Alphaproteobacteria bacterium]